MSRQLTKLSQPFPKELINKAPKGGADYIGHAIITQRLLEIVGPFSFRIDREIYDGELLTGAVCTLTVQIDHKWVEIQEAGDCDSDVVKATGEYVTKGNGARLKNASSDAFKRCAMRAGVGLHLWSKDDYFLYTKLKDAEPDDAQVLQIAEKQQG